MRQRPGPRRDRVSTCRPRRDGVSGWDEAPGRGDAFVTVGAAPPYGAALTVTSTYSLPLSFAERDPSLLAPRRPASGGRRPADRSAYPRLVPDQDPPVRVRVLGP